VYQSVGWYSCPIEFDSLRIQSEELDEEEEEQEEKDEL
jgi:hypothetical protein